MFATENVDMSETMLSPRRDFLKSRPVADPGKPMTQIIDGVTYALLFNGAPVGRGGWIVSSHGSWLRVEHRNLAAEVGDVHAALNVFGTWNTSRPHGSHGSVVRVADFPGLSWVVAA